MSLTIIFVEIGKVDEPLATDDHSFDVPSLYMLFEGVLRYAQIQG